MIVCGLHPDSALFETPTCEIASQCSSAPSEKKGGQGVAIAGGCVETGCCATLLRGGVLAGFIEYIQRIWSVLIPDLLEDWIGEDECLGI
jgi:hypothetical protein